MIFKLAEKKIQTGVLHPVIRYNKLILTGENGGSFLSFLCNTLLTVRQIEALAKARQYHYLNGIEPKSFMDRLALKFGYVSEKAVAEKLHSTSVYLDCAKRLDEHRELCEYLIEYTDIVEYASWHVGHLLHQDEYLVNLFELVYGEKPNPHSREYPHYKVRPRPSELR